MGSLRPLRVETPLPHRPDLPARQTSFVGRAKELAELAELLAAPVCRLLTVLGPGGIGKSSLALEAAVAAGEAFADGVAFAPLQAVGDGEALARAVATAVGCTLTGREDARDQVARFLRPARLLLVLDNFEQLIEESPWLGDLLTAAPGLCIIVTSREALNLREEWRYPLAGLVLPGEVDVDPVPSEAVRLFVERAQQARRDFSLAAERAGVVRLCRIAEGLPLALELAAAWTKTLPCDTIAAEIERNLAFLATDLRNVPSRHRSMQAAFDHSWALLTDYERYVFRRLAVFRGGFSREAAERVAGAMLPLLSSLVDKSLLRSEADGRFHLHELLRQYADEHLRAAPEEAARADATHRDFYLTFLADHFGPITSGDQRGATTAILGELDNIRAAWHSAAAADDGAALGRAAHTLTVFSDIRAHYGEGLAMLEEGLRVLRAATPSPLADRIIAAMLVDKTRLHHRLGQIPAMRATLAEYEAFYAHLDGPPPPGQMTDPLLWRGLLALIDGHYVEAARLGVEVIRRNTADDRPGNLPLAWWIRAAATLWQEDIDTAGEYARRCAEEVIAAGDRWHLAYGRNLQGHVAVARGNYAEARQHYEASYAIREEFDDPEGIATSLAHLAKLAAQSGEWEASAGLYRRSLTIARGIGDRITLSQALNGLGTAASAARDYAAAGRYFAEGLQLVAESRFMRLLIAALVNAGDWLLLTGRPGEAVGPLALAAAHPASDQETRVRARRLLVAVAAVLPSRDYDAAVERTEGANPADMADRLAPLLTAPLLPDAAAAATVAVAEVAPVPASPATTASLIEPLTARELAVLQLIAAGRSNREISDELFLAMNTIRSYNHQLFGKLGVGSRTQAIARARALGMID